MRVLLGNKDIPFAEGGSLETNSSDMIWEVIDEAKPLKFGATTSNV